MKVVICSKDCSIDQPVYELIDQQIQILKDLSKKRLNVKIIVQRRFMNQFFTKISILGPKRYSGSFSCISDRVFTCVANVFEKVRNFLCKANEKTSIEYKRKVSRLFDYQKSSLDFIKEENSKFVFDSKLIGFGT